MPKESEESAESREQPPSLKTETMSGEIEEDVR